MSDVLEPGTAGPARSRDAAAHGEESSQFVMFHVQDEKFAVRLEEVQEIIRMPDLVRVPMSPPALEGLANLRGTVLPVISLREVFRFPTALHDDATRVVVLDQGRPVGLIVDRMANVTSVAADRIESAATIHGTVATDLLTGMIKDADGRSMVMILDAGQVVRHEFKAIAAREGAAARAVRPRRKAGAMPGRPNWTRTSWSASRSPARNTPSRSARCRRSCNCPSGLPRCRRRPAMCSA